MSNSNGNRLDRIEAIVEFNSRAIQAIMEQRATERLEHEERMKFLAENQRQLIQTQRGIADLASSLDEDRASVLKKLTAIENKLDSLVEGNQ